MFLLRLKKKRKRKNVNDGRFKSGSNTFRVFEELGEVLKSHRSPVVGPGFNADRPLMNNGATCGHRLSVVG